MEQASEQSPESIQIMTEEHSSQENSPAVLNLSAESSNDILGSVEATPCTDSAHDTAEYSESSPQDKMLKDHPEEES